MGTRERTYLPLAPGGSGVEVRIVGKPGDARAVGVHRVDL